MSPIVEAFKAFEFTIVQATLSAFGTLFFGFIGAMGLLGLRPSPIRKSLEVLLLIPNFLPALFVILAALNLLAPFPFGLGAVVALHIVINMGLVAVSLTSLIELRLANVSRLAQVDGAKRLPFFLKIALPLLTRDLGYVFAFVFALCFASLAIPLMVGGSTLSSVEVLIYQKIRGGGGWAQALVLAGVQLLLMASLFWLIGLLKAAPLVFETGGERRLQSQKSSAAAFLSWRWGVLIPLAGSLFIPGGLFQGLSVGWSQLQSNGAIREAALIGTAGTLALGLLSGTLTIVALFAVATYIDQRWVDRVLTFVAAPSAVLIGFFFLWVARALFGHNLPPSLFVFFNISMAITILYFSGLYRLKWREEVQNLRRQVFLAQSLGAGRLSTLFQIQGPQLWPTAVFLAGVVAFWSTGDFVISSLLSGRETSLALVVQGLTGAYRLEIATVLMWPLLAVGAALMTFFWSLRYVARQKS